MHEQQQQKKKQKSLRQFSIFLFTWVFTRTTTKFVIFFRHIMKQTHIYAHERKKNTQQQIEINDSIEFWFFFSLVTNTQT